MAEGDESVLPCPTCLTRTGVIATRSVEVTFEEVEYKLDNVTVTECTKCKEYYYSTAQAGELKLKIDELKEKIKKEKADSSEKESV